MTIILVVAAAAVFLVWLLRFKHVKPEIVPPWISATGSIATFISVAVAVSTYRSQRRSTIEDQACQVRLLRTRFIPGPTRNDKFTWWMEVTNRSDESVYDLNIMAVRANVERDPGTGVPVWLRSVEFSELIPGLITSALPKNSQIKPSETWETQWVIDDEQGRHRGRSVVAFQMTVMDAKGRIWLVSDNYEPEKITRRARSRSRQLRT
ncbi:hypothetical protein [Nocardia wallacei]|uniref:hypothetical protein n=1 Tax=Nocardia wallacei TaxID=480035 RepID=UPI0024562BDE|nr:hypothetical protein [Nocardia wallacei]